jgi:hypothetical protein
VICQAVYNTEAEVPAQFKADFQQRADGKWVMKEDAVPGAAELLNPGLAANRDRALTQKATAETKAATAEARAAEAVRELEQVRAPGAKVLTPEQAKEWEKFAGLGIPAKDAEKIIKTDFPRLQEAETLRSRQQTWAKAVEQLQPFGVNLNLEALSDLLTHPQRGAGLELESRPVEIDNGQGGKVTVNLPHIIKRVPAASGKADEFELKATFLLDYAAAEWPAWAVQAITSAPAAGDGRETGGGGFNVPATGGAGGSGLLPLTTGNGGAGGGGSAGAGGSQFGGGQFGSLKLPGQTGGGGLKLPAMGAGGGGSAGGGTGGGGATDNNALAKQYNERRDAGRTSPLQRGGGSAGGGGGQQQQQQQRQQ